MWRFVVYSIALAFGASCVQGQAVSCNPAEIGSAPSRLGIDYANRLPSPLAEIFAQGEAERLASLTSDPGSLNAAQIAALRQEWRDLINGLFAGTLPDSFTGSADEVTLDLARAAAPTMLARLKACGPDADPRLAYLKNVRLDMSGGDLE